MDTLDKILKLLSDKKINDNEFEKVLGFSRSTVSDWKNSKSKSYLKYAKQIADYFKVSTDYLLGNEPLAPELNDIKHDEIESAIVNEIKDMNKETKKDILSYIKYKKQQKD